MATEPPRSDDAPASSLEAEGLKSQGNSRAAETPASLRTQPLHSGASGPTGAVPSANASADPLASRQPIDTVRMPLGRPAARETEQAGSQSIQTPSDSTVARLAARPVRRRPEPDPVLDVDPNFDPVAWDRSFGEKREVPLFPDEAPRVKKEVIVIQLPPAPPAASVALSPTPVVDQAPVAAFRGPRFQEGSQANVAPPSSAAAALPMTDPQWVSHAPVAHAPDDPPAHRVPSRPQLSKPVIFTMAGVFAVLLFVLALIARKKTTQEELSTVHTTPSAEVKSVEVRPIPDVPHVVATVAPLALEPVTPTEPARNIPAPAPAPPAQTTQSRSITKGETSRLPAVVRPHDEAVTIVTPKTPPKHQANAKSDAGLADIDDVPDNFIRKSP